ncbi:hypothetical protein BDY24DRAFT_395922 [Mrakia frigida]|uniref:uncharacterized protein n=1 Tax=Mrakia frigida TaxID=29902 RepID=UPI003FCC1062
METATNALKSVLPVALGGEPAPTPTVAAASTSSDPAVRTDIKTEEEKKRDVENLTKDAQPGSFAAGGTGAVAGGERKEETTSATSGLSSYLPNAPASLTGNGTVTSVKEGGQGIASSVTSSLPSFSSTTKEGATSHEAFPTREPTFAPERDKSSEGYLAKATSALSSNKDQNASQTTSGGQGVASSVASSLPSVPSLTRGQDQDRSSGPGIAEKISSSLPSSIAPTHESSHSHEHEHEHESSHHPHGHKHHHKHHHEHIVAPSFVSKTGGVGSLPGTPNEAGVAVLPDEKQEMQREGLGDQGIGKVEQIGELGAVAAAGGAGGGEGRDSASNNQTQAQTQTQAQPTVEKANTPGAYDPTSMSGEGPHGLVWDDQTGAFVHRRDLEGAGKGL